MLFWLGLVSLLTFQDYFLDFDFRPPRLFLFLAFLLLTIAALLIHPKSRAFIGCMPITTLTYLHIVRVPVEIVLWWLFLNGAVAEAMTFEGINYDILSGISAPFAGLFLLGTKRKHKIAAVVWNLVTLLLLVNIVFTAIKASPYFFDPQYFDQPNIAVFHFPYILLPLFVVPAVLFCHIASFYQLIMVKDKK